MEFITFRKPIYRPQSLSWWTEGWWCWLQPDNFLAGGLSKTHPSANTFPLWPTALLNSLWKCAACRFDTKKNLQLANYFTYVYQILYIIHYQRISSPWLNAEKKWQESSLTVCQFLLKIPYHSTIFKFSFGDGDKVTSALKIWQSLRAGRW